MDELKITNIPAAGFMQFPNSLWLTPKYRGISLESRCLYMILRNRLNLSIGNYERFTDSKGLFVYFRQSELASLMGCSVRSVKRAVGELKEVKLIAVDVQGFCKPAKIRIYEVEPPCEGSLLSMIDEANKSEGTNLAPPEVTGMTPHEVTKLAPPKVSEMSPPYIEEDLHEEDLHDKYLQSKSLCEKSKKPSKRFMKPTIEEVQQYINEKNYHFDAEEFWNHYENCEWEIGRTGKKMKNWKLACRTWENNQLRFNKRNNSKRSPIAPPRPNKNEGFHVEEM